MHAYFSIDFPRPPDILLQNHPYDITFAEGQVVIFLRSPRIQGFNIQLIGCILTLNNHSSKIHIKVKKSQIWILHNKTRPVQDKAFILMVWWTLDCCGLIVPPKIRRRYSEVTIYCEFHRLPFFLILNAMQSRSTQHSVIFQLKWIGICMCKILPAWLSSYLNTVCLLFNLLFLMHLIPFKLVKEYFCKVLKRKYSKYLTI